MPFRLGLVTLVPLSFLFAFQSSSGGSEVFLLTPFCVSSSVSEGAEVSREDCPLSSSVNNLTNIFQMV